jgi:hypothetical protein
MTPDQQAHARTVMEEATRVMLQRINKNRWPDHPGQAEPWDINRGWCVDWARLVCARVPGAVMDEYDDTAAVDDTATDMLHTFVRLGGLCFDAECHDGVSAPTGLPCFSHPYDRPGVGAN